jgi:hypothetical protein
MKNSPRINTDNYVIPNGRKTGGILKDNIELRFLVPVKRGLEMTLRINDLINP